DRWRQARRREPAALQPRAARHRMGTDAVAAPAPHRGDGVLADRPGAPAAPPQAESDGRAPRPHAGATRARVAAGAAERDRDPEDFASRSDARERGGAVEAAHEGGSGG